MTHSESLLWQFADHPRDKQRQNDTASRLIESDAAMLSAAESTYLEYCQSLKRAADPAFRTKFIGSWSDFTRNALSHIGPACPDAVEIELGADSPALYVVWHFPEYPLLLHSFHSRNVMVAVAQDAEWLQPLAKAGLAANFTRTDGLRALRRACERRQSVAMMADFCYEGTRHRVANFLGAPCRTPSGLIELALRFGLAIRLVSIAGDFIATEIAPAAGAVDDYIGWLNRRIGERIEFDPTRWLLWPSLAARVVE